MLFISVSARPHVGRLDVVQRHVAQGASLAEMAALMAADLPADFWGSGVALIDGHRMVEPEEFSGVVPQAGENVAFVALPRGGKALQLFASIAVVAGQAFAFSIPGVGSFLSAGIGLAGSMLLARLQPKPPREKPPKQLGEAGFSSNALKPYEQIPTVLGVRRVPAPYIAPPLIEPDGDAAFGRAIIGLAGRHDLTEPLVNGSPIDFLEENYRGGEPSDKPPEVYTTTWWQSAGTEFSRHNLETNKKNTKRWFCAHNDDGEEAVQLYDLPQAHYFPMGARHWPDRIRIDLRFQQGLFRAGTAGNVGVAFRLGFFKAGHDPVFLPEVHYITEFSSPARARIIIDFSADPGGLLSPSSLLNESPWSFTYTDSTQQTNDGAVADSYYGTGSGSHMGVEGTNTLRIYCDLDSVTIPEGASLGIKMGAAYREDRLVANNSYSYDGGGATDISWFGYYDDAGDYACVEDQIDLVSQCAIEYVTREYDVDPLALENIATYELRTKNQSVDQVTVLAARYVEKRWNGVSWVAAPHVSSNPAAIFHDLVTNATPQLLARPLGVSLVDEDALGRWYEFCEREGLECSAFIPSGSLEDALQVVVQAGHGYLRRSESWSVYFEEDRAHEEPVHIYSPRNSRNFQVEKAFDHKPHALRVTYDDRDDNWQTRPDLIVYADGYDASTATLFETADYRGIDNEWNARRRAKLDLDLLYARDKTYTLETDARYLVTPRGAMVGVSSPVLNELQATAGVRHVVRETSGGVTTITGLVLDTAIELQSGTTGVAISTLNGTVVLGETATVGPAREITFSTALEDDDAIAEGCMASFGVVGEEYGRFIVDDIQPASDSMARVVLVDEAPSVFRGAGPSLARRLLDAWGGTGVAVDFTDGSLRIFDADHPELIFDGPFADRMTITGTLSPSADGCYFDGSNYATLDAVLTPWADSAMTMFVVFKVPAILGATQFVVHIDAGGTTNRHYIEVKPAGKIQMVTIRSGVVEVSRAPADAVADASDLSGRFRASR